MMNYPIDRSKWKKPTYEGHYDDLAVEYEGIRCKCKRCEKSFVFEPIDQKRQFEALGRFPFWLPNLCNECQGQWEIIYPKIKSFETAWENNELLSSDVETIKEWLSLLNLSVGFYKKDYSSRASMLRNIIST